MSLKALSRLPPWLVFTLLVVVPISIYLPALNAPFVLDDGWNVKDNPHVQIHRLSWDELYDAATKSAASNRPLVNVTFALNYYFRGGYEPRDFRLVNIIIHTVNTVLLYLVVVLTLRQWTCGESKPSERRLAGLVIALLWACHPLQTQSVIYIVQRMTSLATLFYLLTFFCYLRGRAADRPWPWWSAALISWLLALACKEIVIVLPIAVWLHEWFFRRNLDRAWPLQSVRYGLVFLPVVLVLGWLFLPNPVAVLTDSYATRDFTMGQRLLTECRVLGHYLSLLLLPLPGRFNLDYDFLVSTSLLTPLTTLFAAGMHLGLLAAAVVFSRSHRVAAFAVVWFYLHLLLESSILPLELVFEHRMYLPSIGVLAAAVWCGRKLHPPWRQTVAAVLIGALSLATVQRGLVWRDLVMLWQDCVAKSPNKPRAHYNLGQAYSRAGKLDLAYQQYLKTLELDPKHADAHNNVGYVLYSRDHQIEAAMRHFQTALELRPDYPEAHNNLGSALANLGRLDEAIVHFAAAAKNRPNYADAYKNLGSAFALKGEFDTAIARFQQAIRIEPGNPEYQAGLRHVQTLQAKRRRAAP